MAQRFKTDDKVTLKSPVMTVLEYGKFPTGTRTIEGYKVRLGDAEHVFTEAELTAYRPKARQTYVVTSKGL